LDFLATAIGSLPHANVKDALDLVFDTIPNAPCCPQLSKISPNEDMLIQYTENFPGIRTDDNLSNHYVDLDSENYFEELEELFIDFEEVIASDELNDEILNKYAISEAYASAFPSFLSRLKANYPKYIKGQVIGPFTFGTSTFDKDKKCVFYDETYREVITKMLTLKALWQVKEFRKVSPNSKNIIFIDEPTMSQLGTSAFITVTKEDVQDTTNQIVDVLHKYNILVGMHCCGKADWSILLGTNLDIINFDAFSFAENFSLYSQELNSFIDRGGKIAWGVVPTLDVDALEKTNEAELSSVYENAKNLLVSKGIDEQKIINASMLTPSCGAGSLSIEYAQKAMLYLKMLSVNLSKRYASGVK